MIARQASWKVALLMGAIAICGYFAMPSLVAKDLCYLAIGASSLLQICTGVRRNHPADATPWLLIGAAVSCFILGDTFGTVYDFLGADIPFPSAADALYLCGYPFLATGVLRLGRAAGRPGSRENRADAGIVTLGAIALSWHLLMGSYAHDETLGTLGKLVTMAYPVMDLGVLFIAVSTLLFSGMRRPADKLITAALGAVVIADFVYDVLLLHGSYATGSLIDAGWLINYVLLGAAALHPSMARVLPPAPDPLHRRRWMPLVLTAGFVSPTILFVGSMLHVAVDVRVLAATSMALIALVSVRVSWLFTRISHQTDQLRQQTGLLREHADSLQAALSVRELLQADLRHQASHDSLTGLANRALLNERVDQALSLSSPASGMIAVIFCDLDGFKTVNDSLGHKCGDDLLVAVGERLRRVVRADDTVARLGGDEFAILLNDVEDPRTATAVAEHVVSALREPYMLAGRSVSISVSAGITFGDRKKTTELLLSEADSAMYEAKAEGKDHYQVFQTSMRSRVVERMELSNSMRHGLERSEFYLQYQPHFSMRDGHLEGFEALARWNSPLHGAVGPDRFIPVAEETGLIVPLGRWALETACIQAASWPARNGRALTVSVNLSGRQLRDPDLLDDVRTALAFSAIAADQLILEITESMLMVNPVQTVSVLTALKSMGIRLAIDDFGTGYSSLSQLRQFPFDILKIDKAFVDPLSDLDGEGAAIVRSIVSLARDLRLSTVAEGIEDEQQRRVLTALGVDSAQGFLLSRPLDAAAAQDLAQRSAPGDRLEPIQNS